MEEFTTYQLTCPLLFYGTYVCVGEAPVLGQDLPLPVGQVLCGQPPHDRAEVLRLLLVVLPEAQLPPLPGVTAADVLLGGRKTES